MAESSGKDRVLPTFRQSKAARQLIDWKQSDLAEASGVTRATIERFEGGKMQPQLRTLEKIADAFERRGIVFTNGDSPGVKLNRDRAIIPT